MDEALEQLRRLAAESEDGRRQVTIALRDLQFSLEGVHNTIHKYGHMGLQSAAVQIGIHLGLFHYLVQADAPVTAQQVSEKTGAEAQLMTRILRFLASIGAIDEKDRDQYTDNNVTRNLTDKVAEAGLSHYFGTAEPPYHALPEFLKETGYKNPTDDTKTAFGAAFNTTMSPYAWFAGNPSQLAHFNTYMALRRKPDATWLSVYPVVAEASDWPAERGLYVNIGGGIGHQCAQFREKYPQLQGRVVLQDLPHSIAEALPTPGVENMAHDMFKPQPVRGAKFYYLRGVLHNQPPHKVQLLLENVKTAMEPESVLLIDEMVLPEVGVNYMVASIDVTMLSTFASMERTEAQWRETLDRAGLELGRTYMYYPRNYESVMEVRLPRAGKQILYG